MSIERQTIAEFLDAVAAKQPTPGGGAVASVVAALGAALGSMVVNYSVGKKKLSAHDPLHRQALDELLKLRREALELAEADAEAYAKLSELMKLPADDSLRQQHWAGAVDAAIAAPLAVMRACGRMLEALQQLQGKINEQLASDLAIAALLAEAGARTAAWNVRINLPLLQESGTQAALNDEIDQLAAGAARHCSAIERACGKAHAN